MQRKGRQVAGEIKTVQITESNFILRDEKKLFFSDFFYKGINFKVKDRIKLITEVER